MKPLLSLKVLDLTSGNPFVGSILADYGANVLKIEAPTLGDAIRRRGAQPDGTQGAYQAYYDRGKKSMTLDIEKPAGAEILRRLARAYDLIVINRPEKELSALGLGYEALKAENPRLVYGVLTPFGEEGPWKDLPDYDLIVMARSGLLEKTGFPERPTKFGAPIGYLYTAWHLAGAMLAAYRQAQQSDEGALISASAWHTVMSLDDTFAECLLGLNTLPKRIGNGFPTTNPTDTFRCQNGWFALSIGSDAQWISFARAAGNDVWAEDPRYAHDPARSMEHYFGELDGQLRDYFASITIEEADRVCREAMVPGGPCNTVKELVCDEQVAARRMLVHVQDAVLGDTLQVGKPAKFLRDNEQDDELFSAPRLGEHTRAVLRELGLGENELHALQAERVI